MSWECLSDTEPVARNEHKCVWCGEKILIGEKHTLQTGRFEGRFQSNRFHTECVGPAMEDCSEGEGFAAYEHKRGSTEAR